MKRLMIALVVVIFVFVTGCTNLRDMNNPEYAHCMNLSDEFHCTKSGCWNDRSICLYGLAQDYSDVSLCNEIKIKDLFGDPITGDYDCAANIALSKNDSSLCYSFVRPDDCLIVYNVSRKNYPS